MPLQQCKKTAIIFYLDAVLKSVTPTLQIANMRQRTKHIQGNIILILPIESGSSSSVRKRWPDLVSFFFAILNLNTLRLVQDSCTDTC